MSEIDLLLSRRSIRRYTQESVDERVMMELVKAGMAAPSAFNQQPWEFVLVKDKEVLEKIAKYHPFASMARYAAGFIIVCGNADLDKKNLKMWPQDCAAATENILLAAHALNLGAVWIGVYPNKEHMKVFRKICKIPDDIVPFSGVCFGVPARSKDPTNRFVESRIHWDFW
jgi:nitroreductase